MGQALDTLVVDLAEEVRGRYYGKYRGIVDSVPEDERLGRIVAKVPSVAGDTALPPAWPCVPFAGQDHGFVVLPTAGDGVWIEFEGGDPSKPIWTGCWWAKDEMPSPSGPKQRVLITSEGLKLVLDDDARQIQLLHPDGAEITMTSDSIAIKVGTAKVELSPSGVSVNDGAFQVAG